MIPEDQDEVDRDHHAQCPCYRCSVEKGEILVEREMVRIAVIPSVAYIEPSYGMLELGGLL